MQRRRVPTSDQALDPHLVTRVVAGIGSPRFAAHCLEALQPVLPATLCTVYAVNAAGRVETVSAASSYHDAAERTAAVYVRERYDRLDPHMAWLAARKVPRVAQHWICHLRGDELADAAYRAACYTDVGIRERLSLMLQQPDGRRAALSFYRSLALPEFGPQDVNALAAHAAVLAEASVAHVRCEAVVRGVEESDLVAQLRVLSQREREVIGHLLAGHTAKETARSMDVALTTVRTHQYRAFRRLGLRSIKDLLRAARPADA